MSTQLQGISASPGIAVGPVYVYTLQHIVVDRQPGQSAQVELDRLAAALATARQQLEVLTERARQGAGADEAAVFEAHQLFLDDPDLLDRVHALIEQESVKAEYAWQTGTNHYAETLSSIGDEYLAARAADVRDVSQRVLRILAGASSEVTGPQAPSVIVAEELTPSDTVMIDKSEILAFCTARGGPTSHVAILSKALGIPAVVGLGESFNALKKDLTAIVDGGSGTVLIEPDESIRVEYRQRAAALQQLRAAAEATAHQPAITLDNVRVEVVANIGSLSDAQAAIEIGAEGVGLLRTEFLYLDRADAPGEEEQVETYRAIFDMLGQRPIVVRTLDIGGDKPAPYLKMPPELNPFLGVRGIRLCLAKPDVLHTQLRALLRAGEGHNLKIMFPMVAVLEEVIEARRHFDQVRRDLEVQHVKYAQQVEIGIMVEVPAVALNARTLAEAVDFFSIGTNDLSQYTMAADRTQSEVATLADAFNPAVLQLIKMVIEAAHARGRWVGLCGELAGDPLAVPVLLGLGLDEFSMGYRSVPIVKQAIRRCSLDQSRQIAATALSLPTASEVRSYLKSIADKPISN